MWKVKARKAMFVLTIKIEDDFLQQLKHAKTPKNLGTPWQRFLQEEWCEITKAWKLAFVNLLTEYENQPIPLKCKIFIITNLSKLENLLANKEELENPLQSLPIKEEEDKFIFTKRKACRNRE